MAKGKEFQWFGDYDPGDFLDNEKLVPHEVGGDRLAKILTGRKAKKALGELARVDLDGNEKIFYIYGDIEDPDFYEVSEVVTGDRDLVSGREETFPTNSDTAYVMMVIHSEPRHERDEVVFPSDEDVSSLQRETWNLFQKEWMMRPIDMVVYPESGRAMFYQQTDSSGFSTNNYYRDFPFPGRDQEQINGKLRNMGLNVAVVKFPLEKKELGNVLPQFEFRVDRFG